MSTIFYEPKEKFFLQKTCKPTKVLKFFKWWKITDCTFQQKMYPKNCLQEDAFNDTFVELLFVGDIDRDGKLDFIFGANKNYEEERVILFLSSKAENGNLVKKVSEIAIQFDC